MNILFIQSNPLENSHFELLLSKLGYSIVGKVGSCDEGLDLIEFSHVDLIIATIFEDATAQDKECLGSLGAFHIPIILIINEDVPAIYEKVANFTHVFYLVKPFHSNTLESAIRILSQQIRQEPQFIRGTSRGEIIAIKDILYIEVERTYTFIQTKTKRYAFKKSLTLLKQHLPLGRFLQIHRSFLVQKKFVKKIDFEKSLVELEEGHLLPVSRRAKHELQSKNLNDII
ncbi:MAG TPA: hypothetical protein DCR35_18095 [Runella sp.]|nr:hypothetical protein [Runella sp.]